MKKYNVKRILIYRLGSLGDTVVALPCFHLVARAFPNAKRYVLCNLIDNSKASHTSAILGDSAIVHDYISYPVGLRSFKELVKLRRAIKALQPEILIYLAASRGRIKALRDALFFRSCGIKTLIGVPYSKELQENLWINDKQCYEQEAHRLARCITDLGSAELDNPESWDLKLTNDEKKCAREMLSDVGKDIPFIACSVGAKVTVKDWGIKNWIGLIERLSCRYSEFGLAFVGAESEHDLCEQVGKSWAGKRENFCGNLSPRESAAVLEKAMVFIGHDSGPMHLAAAMWTPCIAIFSARNKPGVWFPYGQNHQIIYHKTVCYGCGLDVCEREAKKCITSITINEVYDAIVARLESRKSKMQK